jgi:hypothetical protein
MLYSQTQMRYMKNSWAPKVSQAWHMFTALFTCGDSVLRFPVKFIFGTHEDFTDANRFLCLIKQTKRDGLTQVRNQKRF